MPFFFFREEMEVRKAEMELAKVIIFWKFYFSLNK
jgi:hypothetical protein